MREREKEREGKVEGEREGEGEREREREKREREREGEREVENWLGSLGNSRSSRLSVKRGKCTLWWSLHGSMESVF